MIQTKRLGNWMEFIIPKNWEGLTIEDVFKHKWKAPKKLIHQFRMEHKVKTDAGKTDWTIPLVAGEKLLIHLFEDSFSTVEPFYLELEVLFEDDHLIVFNKPPFLNTHPNTNDDKETLLNAAVFYLLSKGEQGSVRHIHRLDRDTSGAILFAKHPLAGAILDGMLERREIKRTYVAVLHGVGLPKKGTINEPIGRDRHHATRKRVSPTGQQAVTHYKVLKKDNQSQLTTVACWLDTGRTHQIRVHFSHLGNPLAGDLLYSGKPVFPRQALHSGKLEFTHPLTREQIICRAPFLDEPPIFTVDIDSI